ncbi:MAG: hypothetical protein J6W31_01950 [Clostridia bacterium]|nr:hypothetical protein [Clostridia bacterium]
MKKLSLLLALLMIFTCCALASCSEEETSSAPEASSTAPATSSEAPAASSEPEAESSEEAPAESSEEEVSTEPEYVKNPDAISTEGNNVAAGKEYTISEQFRMGGADVGWGWDENAAPSYPDDGFELTDGQIPLNDYREAG